MRWELRLYRIEVGALEAFTHEWRERILPLRREHGFEVRGPWIAEDGRFVWLLGHDDFAEADRAYYASPARRAIDPDPARYVAQAEHLCMDDA